MAGAITTLGVGSGLPLADMLEDLREIDERVLDIKRDDSVTLEAKVEEFTVVKNKLLALKSSALDLSLESTFLKRVSSSSDEKVATISVSEGAEPQSVALDVEHLASKSSWMTSSGFDSSSSIVNISSSQDSVQKAASYSEAFVPADGEITIEYGSSGNKAVITVGKGDTIGQLVNTVNGLGLPLQAFAVQDEDGQYSFRVNSTDGDPANNQVVIDGGESGLSFVAPDAEFSYQVGEDTKTFTISGDTTLQGIVDLVNSDLNNLGVTARIINSGVGDSPYKFVLQADDTGEDNRITITGQLSGMAMEEDGGYDAEAGESVSLNAGFVLDGISYQRQTNNISDVMAGVTLDLQSAGTTTLSVSNDDTLVADKIASMIDAYVDVVGEIKSESAYDSETGEFGPLSGSSVQSVVAELDALMSAFSFGDTEGNITSLFDMGMEMNRDGTISLDRSVLEAKLASNGEDLQEFFLGDSERGVTGFADKLNDRLRSLTGAMGPMEVEKTSAQEKIYDLELAIEAETSRLDKRYELLTKQFVQLDQYMSQMTSLSDFLTGQFESLSNSWQSSNK